MMSHPPKPTGPFRFADSPMIITVSVTFRSPITIVARQGSHPPILWSEGSCAPVRPRIGRPTSISRATGFTRFCGPNPARVPPRRTRPPCRFDGASRNVAGGWHRPGKKARVRTCPSPWYVEGRGCLGRPRRGQQKTPQVRGVTPLVARGLALPRCGLQQVGGRFVGPGPSAPLSIRIWLYDLLNTKGRKASREVQFFQIFPLGRLSDVIGDRTRVLLLM